MKVYLILGRFALHRLVWSVSLYNLLTMMLANWQIISGTLAISIVQVLLFRNFVK